MNDNGLAELKAHTGTFLACSTAPGAVALDGLQGNSPFTQALAFKIAAKGLPVEQVLKHVRIKVMAETQGQHTPWDTSSLTTQFAFHPAELKSAEEIARAVAIRPVQGCVVTRKYTHSPLKSEVSARRAVTASFRNAR